MNFDLDDEQIALRDLARQIIGDLATVEHVKAVEAADDFDHQTWNALAAGDLLSLCVPVQYGGSGYGMVELALLLEEQGRCVTPLPLLHTVATAIVLAEHADAAAHAGLETIGAGATILTSALAEWGANDVLHPSVRATATADGAAYLLTGSKPSVPYLQHAGHVIVPARVTPADDSSDEIALFVVGLHDTPGVVVEPVATTNREPAAHLALDGVRVATTARFGDSSTLRSLLDHHLAGLAALQVGVAAAAIKLTAEYVAGRQQFGKALSSFQAVTQRAADAYITTEAMRVTALNAAWHLAEHVDARQAVMVAAYWADRGAQDVVLATQHLHGGIGSDLDYPVHRYFLWGSQLASTLGGESSHLTRLGHLIAIGTGV